MADKIVGMETLPSNVGIPVKYVDQGDGTFALKVATTGGGGGGSSLADVLLTDSNNVLFVGRDSGGTSGTIFTFYRLDTQAAYTPVGTIKAAGNNVVTVADGADVTQGAIADAAIAAGAAGTVGAKLRAVSRDIGTLSAAPTTASSAAYEASHVGKASAGTLFSVSIYNSSNSAQFYQLHDAAALPANNAVPKSVIRIPAQGTGGWDFGLRGRPFATGIVIANSSTGPTLTTGSADSYFDAVVA